MNISRKEIRRMGFIRDQQGIINRYLREKHQWEQHLENTREFIKSSFSAGDHDSVVVLGSGWLLDVPLDDLARRFREVYLVDIYHPPQIRRRIKEMDHVQLVEADLTGGAIEPIWKFSQRRGGQHLDSLLEKLLLEPPLPRVQTDVMVSVNLLNQLDILLCDYLKERGVINDESLERLRSLIQSFHIEWISATPGCIITDTMEISRDRRGNDSAKPLLYTELPHGFREKHWTWEFDSSGTYRSGFRTRMEVQAVEWR